MESRNFDPLSSGSKFSDLDSSDELSPTDKESRRTLCLPQNNVRELELVKMEDERRLEEAERAKKNALRIAGEEKDKCNVALKLAKAAYRKAERETQKRLNAETKAFKEVDEDRKTMNGNGAGRGRGSPSPSPIPETTNFPLSGPDPRQGIAHPSQPRPQRGSGFPDPGKSPSLFSLSLSTTSSIINTNIIDHQQHHFHQRSDNGLAEKASRERRREEAARGDGGEGGSDEETTVAWRRRRRREEELTVLHSV
ncbi:hypothetical protein CsSME_00015301 [Camellia sinensis var. sinensis]